MVELPSGTVTFLFTDIEGSTQRWEQEPAAMAPALARHDRLLRAAVEGGGGQVFKTVGDAVCAAFASAPAALEASLAGQRSLAADPWAELGALGPLRVRMALHTGTVQPHAGDYTGPPLNRVARLLATGYGGQVLLSGATATLVRQDLPTSATLRDLGEHRLRDLLEPEHVFQLVAPDLLDRFPPLKSLEHHPTNLPTQPTPLVGRDDVLADVEDLLGRDDVRLLTLTGMGGTGKTRLGLQVAADMHADFPDGAFFVDLATVVDPDLVLPTIAMTLGVRETGGQSLRDTLVAYLAGKHLLLLLDNFEQVLAAAPVVADLLAACPDVAVLVTSRARLDLRGEHEFLVPPLATPDPRRLPPLAALVTVAAVALFSQRATAARRDFAVTAANAPAIAAICAKLDGLPLAIELAAARIRLLSPGAILERLTSRLTLLTSGPRNLPARQRTLRTTIAWSYDLLPSAEQALFRRLAVFAGGFSLESAERVVPAVGALDIDVFDGVAALFDQSLLRQTEGVDGEPRFTMLETLREFALERLAEAGEDAATRGAHAGWCLALAEEAKPHLIGPEQAVWLARLETEHDNLRAALAAVEEDGSDRMLRLAGALGRFWNIHSHLNEGRQWLERALAGPAAPGTAIRAQALNNSGVMAYFQSDYATAAARYEESLAISRAVGDQTGVAGALNNLGLVADAQGDYARATTRYEESLAIRRESGDQTGIAAALNNLGMVAEVQGDFDRATALHTESLAIERALGDQRGVAASLNNLATVASARGDHAQAVTLHRESLAIRRVLGDTLGVAASLNNLALTLQEQGDHAGAARLHAESLAIWQELGDQFGYVASLEGIAALAVLMARAERAPPLLAAADALREGLGLVATPVERARNERSLAAAREQLGEPALAELMTSGHALGVEDAVVEAFTVLQEVASVAATGRTD